MFHKSISEVYDGWRVLACKNCGALIGENCHTKSNKLMRESHMCRVDEVNELRRGIIKEPKNQTELVLNWLQTHGKLTRWTAFQELGVAELSSRIGELEGNDWVIPRKRITVVVRNGRKASVTEYLRPTKDVA